MIAGLSAVGQGKNLIPSKKGGAASGGGVRGTLRLGGLV